MLWLCTKLCGMPFVGWCYLHPFISESCDMTMSAGWIVQGKPQALKGYVTPLSPGGARGGASSGASVTLLGQRPENALLFLLTTIQKWPELFGRNKSFLWLRMPIWNFFFGERFFKIMPLVKNLSVTRRLFKPYLKVVMRFCIGKWGLFCYNLTVLN